MKLTPLSNAMLVTGLAGLRLENDTRIHIFEVDRDVPIDLSICDFSHDKARSYRQKNGGKKSPMKRSRDKQHVSQVYTFGAL